MTDLVTLTPYKKAESKKDITIRQLKKENTELKKKIGIYQKGMYDEIEKRDRKLTKAKEKKGDRKMTDEEMAEEYAEKHSFRVPYDGSNKFYDDTDFKASKNGFLAGLKAGRPQWHDLEKDPTDLPKGNNPVLVIIDYLALGKEYAIRENLKEDSKGIIAWCEIPTFDKE